MIKLGRCAAYFYWRATWPADDTLRLNDGILVDGHDQPVPAALNDGIDNKFKELSVGPEQVFFEFRIEMKAFSQRLVRVVTSLYNHP